MWCLEACLLQTLSLTCLITPSPPPPLSPQGVQTAALHISSTRICAVACCLAEKNYRANAPPTPYPLGTQPARTSLAPSRRTSVWKGLSCTSLPPACTYSRFVSLFSFFSLSPSPFLLLHLSLSHFIQTQIRGTHTAGASKHASVQEKKRKRRREGERALREEERERDHDSLRLHTQGPSAMQSLRSAPRLLFVPRAPSLAAFPSPRRPFFSAISQRALQSSRQTSLSSSPEASGCQ